MVARKKRSNGVPLLELELFRHGFIGWANSFFSLRIFFPRHARHSELRSESGYLSASFDRTYNARTMDFLTPAGFLFLACNPAAGLQTHLIRGPRLCLWVVLGMAPNSMVWMGPDCSSWGLPARGTSWRSYINCFGNLERDWVRRSNCMVSRPLDMTHTLTSVSAPEDRAALLGHDGEELCMGPGATARVRAGALLEVQLAGQPCLLRNLSGFIYSYLLFSNCVK